MVKALYFLRLVSRFKFSNGNVTFLSHRVGRRPERPVGPIQRGNVENQKQQQAS